MPDYPLPPWLSPQAAQGWGDLALGAAKSRAQIQQQRDELSQQATQFNIQSQQRAQQIAQEAEVAKTTLDYNHQLEQQKIAIDTAYKNQQIGLRTQDLEIAQQRFDQQTEQAAKRFAANQLFQRAILPAEKGGEGMSTQAAALKYMSPYMTPDATARLSAVPEPFKLGNPVDLPNSDGRKALETSRGHFQILNPPDVFKMGETQPVQGHPELDAVQTSKNSFRLVPKVPANATNAPNSLPVEGEDGTIGYWVAPPGGGKPHWQPVQQNSGSDLRSILKARAEGKTAPTKPVSRKAEGGYKIGALYKGGLRYLGGPPGDESSWEKVK